jgi:hypothetical protein
MDLLNKKIWVKNEEEFDLLRNSRLVKNSKWSSVINKFTSKCNCLVMFKFYKSEYSLYVDNLEETETPLQDDNFLDIELFKEYRNLNVFPNEGKCYHTPELITYLKNHREYSSLENKGKAKTIAWNYKTFWFVLEHNNSSKPNFDIKQLEKFICQPKETIVSNRGYSISLDSIQEKVFPSKDNQFPTSGYCLSLNKKLINYLQENFKEIGSYNSNSIGVLWNEGRMWFINVEELNIQRKHVFEFELNDLIQYIPSFDDNDFECTNTNGYGLNEYREGCKQDCSDCGYYSLIDNEFDGGESNENKLFEIFIPKIEQTIKETNINLKFYKNECIKI